MVSTVPKEGLEHNQAITYWHYVLLNYFFVWILNSKTELYWTKLMWISSHLFFKNWLLYVIPSKLIIKVGFQAKFSKYFSNYTWSSRPSITVFSGTALFCLLVDNSKCIKFFWIVELEVSLSALEFLVSIMWQSPFGEDIIYDAIHQYIYILYDASMSC